MKRLALVLLLVIACGGPPVEEPSVIDPYGNLSQFTVETPTGPVPCISWTNGLNAGGLSCDWSDR